MATNKEALIVEGYQFYDEEDADLARLELEKIKALESRMDYNNSEMMVSVYNRAIMNRTFRTPVGYRFLLELKDYLLKTGAAKETELRAIPMQVRYAKSEERGHVRSGRAGMNSGDEKKEPMVAASSFRISVAMNVVLIILVVIMFLITLYGDNPNMISYKNQIVNKYASWEQELQDREREIRAKERELGITPAYPDRAQDAESE